MKKISVFLHVSANRNWAPLEAGREEINILSFELLPVSSARNQEAETSYSFVKSSRRSQGLVLSPIASALNAHAPTPRTWECP